MVVEVRDKCNITTLKQSSLYNSPSNDTSLKHETHHEVESSMFFSKKQGRVNDVMVPFTKMGMAHQLGDQAEGLRRLGPLGPISGHMVLR